MGLAAQIQGADGRIQAQRANQKARVYLSEIMMDDPAGLKDDNGGHSGWIEICNEAAAPVNLRGWFLTNTRTNLAQWRFPPVALLPGMYLLVFTSGKADTNNHTQLHANFRLASHESYLALVDRSTNIVSELSLKKSSPGSSYGRLPGEPAICGFFIEPTPGRPNSIQGPGFAPRVVFSRPGGAFAAPFTLTLSHGSSNAAIRFTLDGSLPTSGSQIYTEPLLITNSVRVRARVCQEGLFPGPPQSETYLLLHDNLIRFNSSLPVLVMDTLGDDRPTSSPASSVQLMFFEPVHGKTSLTNPPALATHAGFHVRGSSSSSELQTGFAVQCLDEFGREQPRSMLGLPADSEWVLYAPTSYEPVMIHNPFIHQLSRDMGRYSPRTRFIEVYLVRQSGPVAARHYHGIYVLEEKIKAGPNRVNINPLGPEDLRPPAVTGGYLLKVDRLGPGESGLSMAGLSVAYVDPKESIIDLPQRAPQKEYIGALLDNFERALDSTNWLDSTLGYHAYIDVDSWIDYHVLEVLSGNVDALFFSAFFYKPRNGKIAYGPHWDFDRALGSTDGRDDNPRSWNTGRFFSAPLWSRLFRDPDFWQLWVDRWQELRQTYFSLAHINALVDRLANEVREAQPRQMKRWGLQPRGGTYQSEVDLMKNWLSNRIDFIDQQLVQPPRFNRDGGSITPGFVLALSGSTNSKIYYTLDGSDPRLSRGTLASNAFLYEGPILLQSNALLVARAHDLNKRQFGGPRSSTPWSQPVRAKFVVSPTHGNGS